MAAMVTPAMNRVFVNQQLVKVADQVRSQLARARVDAIESGYVRTFRCQQGTNQYHVESVNLDGSTISADAVDGSPQMSILTIDSTLPGDVTFANISLADQTTDTGSTTDPNNPADPSLILFYPDGTSSTAVVTLTNQQGRSIDISLRGLTGLATVSDAQAGGGP